MLFRSRVNIERGATGATSNPIIVADILKSGRYDAELARLAAQGLDDEAIAWALTDMLVRQAQEQFYPIFQTAFCNDGYVSFELDPLIEDPSLNLSHDERVRRYIELGRKCPGNTRIPQTTRQKKSKRMASKQQREEPHRAIQK